MSSPATTLTIPADRHGSAHPAHQLSKRDVVCDGCVVDGCGEEDQDCAGVDMEEKEQLF